MFALACVYHSAYQENRDLGFPASAESVTLDELEAWIEECDLSAVTLNDDVIGTIRVE